MCSSLVANIWHLEGSRNPLHTGWASGPVGVVKEFFPTIHANWDSRRGDFPGGPVVKNPPANAGDMGSIPGPGWSHMPQGN